MAQTIPEHVGFILDGNRRWAKENGLQNIDGHRQGFENLKVITKATVTKGVSFVSAFVFSTDNWNRTPKEVKYLMELAHKLLTRDVAELHKENIRVLWLGSSDKVSVKLQKAIKNAEESTKNNTKGTLAICFNYGGSQEILDATKQLIDRGISADKVTTEVFESALYRPIVPKLDMVLRTSGEKRTSGFMLYRAAYAELIFVEKYWPDFTVKDLDEALNEFGRRKRRHGL